MINKWVHDGTTSSDIVARHGPWSAMSIRLADGSYTREQAVDHRLKRLVQTVADTVGKPLDQCRVLDLACLEGHYGIEFALHGAQAVCVEIREANLAKAAYAINALGLSNCELVQDDVRNLDVATYGRFDVIICSGILYHLRAEDAARLVRQMADCCTRLCIVDTYIAVRETAHATVGGALMGGVVYREHDPGDTAAMKMRDLWASIDNDSSFWFTTNALVTLFAQAGFTSCSDVLLPTHPELTYDRRMFSAIKGQPVSILSSEMTDRTGHVPAPLPDPTNLHPYQMDHGRAYTIGKKLLPQPVKNAVKPTLRRLGLLKTEDSPFDDN